MSSSAAARPASREHTLFHLMLIAFDCGTSAIPARPTFGSRDASLEDEQAEILARIAEPSREVAKQVFVRILLHGLALTRLEVQIEPLFDRSPDQVREWAIPARVRHGERLQIGKPPLLQQQRGWVAVMHHDQI